MRNQPGVVGVVANSNIRYYALAGVAAVASLAMWMGNSLKLKIWGVEVETAPPRPNPPTAAIDTSDTEVKDAGVNILSVGTPGGIRATGMRIDGSIVNIAALSHISNGQDIAGSNNNRAANAAGAAAATASTRVHHAPMLLSDDAKMTEGRAITRVPASSSAGRSVSFSGPAVARP
jgi:hypothetical protein